MRGYERSEYLGGDRKPMEVEAEGLSFLPAPANRYRGWGEGRELTHARRRGFLVSMKELLSLAIP